MQIATTILIPKNLAQEVDKQVNQGRFISSSDFIRSAIKTYLLFQKGELSWEILAAPFRAYARQKKLTEKDIVRIVEKGRHVKTTKNSK